MLHMAFSLSYRMINIINMTPLEAPSNLLQIGSNRKSVALFVQKLCRFEVGQVKNEWENGWQKDRKKMEQLIA